MGGNVLFPNDFGEDLLLLVVLLQLKARLVLNHKNERSQTSAHTQATVLWLFGFYLGQPG